MPAACTVFCCAAIAVIGRGTDAKSDTASYRRYLRAITGRYAGAYLTMVTFCS